jgi:hypothetical protein
MPLLDLPLEILRTILKHLYSPGPDSSTLHICPCLALPQVRNGAQCICHLDGSCSRIIDLPPPIMLTCRRLSIEMRATIKAHHFTQLDFCSLQCLEAFFHRCPQSLLKDVTNLRLRPNIFFEKPPDSSISFEFFWSRIHAMRIPYTAIAKAAFDTVEQVWPLAPGVLDNMTPASVQRFEWDVAVSGARLLESRRLSLENIQKCRQRQLKPQRLAGDLARTRLVAQV